MKTLKYYDDIFDAHADREYLASEGIPAEVLNENTGFVFPITYANPSMRPYIAVPDSCYERAVELVEPEKAVPAVCPDCGSTDVDLRLPGKYAGLTRFIMVPLMAFGVYGGNIRNVYRCNKCRREFRV